MKRKLVVSSDAELGHSRSLIIEKEGYKVDSVATDDEAMGILGATDFDLVLIGRASLLCENRLDPRKRQKYPSQIILEIQPVDHTVSLYASELSAASQLT